MSLLLDVKEVKAATRGPEHGGLTGLQLKDRLSTTTRVVAALIKHRHLRTEIVFNPISGCPTIVDMPEELDRFEAEYISLFVIARQLGRHFEVVKNELTAAGVLPALDPEALGATLYRRSDISKARFPTAKKGTSR